MRDRKKLGIGMVVAGVITAMTGSGILISHNINQKNSQEVQVLGVNESLAGDSDKNVSELVVDVEGAVVRPGVYNLAYGKRVGDAITAAGGITENADQTWVEQSMNKSEKLKDGQKIFIPKKGENKAGESSSLTQGVSINRSNESELEDLNGIGPATAKKIISGRPYSSINELVERKIISQKVFDQIKAELHL